MKYTYLDIPGVVLFEPSVYGDDRGFFYESYNEKVMQEALGEAPDFVQDNHSRSTNNVLRGMHYQIKHAQGKLVRVVRGEVYDVIVDLRRGSETFGQWLGVNLSENNKKLLWVPPGFAHGFYVLSEDAEFLYKTTDFYAPVYERSIIWNDPDINIDWPLSGKNPIVSEKDQKASSFKNAEIYEYSKMHT